MTASLTPLKINKIFLFWLPLAATWLMMSIEGPFLAAIIARLPEAKFNLAAYGVAFSLALVIEAPVIMIMSAATALVENKNSFLKLRNFTNTINIALTIVMGIFLIPALFNFITIELIKLPDQVASLTHKAIIILLPWPAAIGYRRFFQGILIRSNLTRRVAYGTVFRLGAMTLTALGLYHSTNLPGVLVGASALSVGVVIEAIASRLMAYQAVKHITAISETRPKGTTYRDIYYFYYPLALTSLLTLGVHPLVTFFVGQSRFSLESLAVLPVINSLVFIFRSMGLSFQEVGIALIGKDWKGYEVVRNFGIILSICVVLALSAISFSPLAVVWFHTVSGLTLELTRFSILPLQIMTIMPGLSVLLSLQRAILVNARQTSPITMATVLEVVGIITVLFLSIYYFQMIGAVAATLAFIAGRLAANVYLLKPYTAATRRG